MILYPVIVLNKKQLFNMAIYSTTNHKIQTSKTFISEHKNN